MGFRFVGLCERFFKLVSWRRAGFVQLAQLITLLWVNNLTFFSKKTTLEDGIRKSSYELLHRLPQVRNPTSQSVVLLKRQVSKYLALIMLTKTTSFAVSSLVHIAVDVFFVVCSYLPYFSGWPYRHIDVPLKSSRDTAVRTEDVCNPPSQVT